MAIFDTSVLIYALAGEREAQDALERYANEGLATTVINKYELLKGRSIRTKVENSAIDGLISNLFIRDLNEPAISKAASLFDELKSKGRTIDEFDILIAAIAIANDETLVVADKHFDYIAYAKVVNIKQL